MISFAPHHPRSLTTMVAVVLVATTACGSAADTSTPDSSSNVSPEEFGLSLAKLAARIQDTERLISECMTGAGFEYIALDFVSIQDAMSTDQTADGLPDEDYVKQFGLGITTQFDKPLLTFGAGPANAAYLETLPATDQVAFRRALWGETPDRNHARALEDEDFSQTGGCTRSAAEQTYSPSEINGDYVNPNDTLIKQDPRMIAALRQWSDCMRVEGYAYGHPDEVDVDLLERLDAISQGQDPAALTGPALDALHDLQGEELAIVAAMVACEEEHVEPAKAQIELEIYGPEPP